MGRSSIMEDLSEEELSRDRVGRGSRLRLIKERGVDIDEEESAYDADKKPSPCSVTCCGFFVGGIVTAAIAAAVLFVVLMFAISYTGLDSGLCGPDEIGIGRVCVSCPSRNASPDEAEAMCRNLGSEVARFGSIKALIDRVRAFAPDNSNDFIAVSRMHESSTTCTKATSGGAASVPCPAKAAVICQRPRPLGPFQESIRRTRIVMGIEPETAYSRHAFMFSDAK